MIPPGVLARGLAENLALLVSLACLYGLLWPVLRRAGPAVYTLASGAVFGGIAVAAMAMGTEAMPGVSLDQRMAIIAMAGAFNGPGSAAVAGVIAGMFRMALGGIGALPGTGAIATAAVIGAAVHWRWGDRVAEFGIVRFALLGLTVTVTGLAWILAIPDGALARQLLLRAAVPLTLLSSTGTAGLGLLLAYLQGERRRLMRTEASLDHSQEAMFWVDSAGHIADANAAAAALTGYTREELCGMRASALHAWASPERWPAIWRKAAEERLLRLMSELHAKDGRVVPIDVSAAHVELDTETVLSLCVRDISDRRRAEEAAEALAAVGRDLTATLDVGEASRRVVSTLLSVFRARRAVLHRFDPPTQSLICVAVAGEADGTRWVGRSAPGGMGVAGLAVTGDRPVWCPDVLADERVTLPAWLTEWVLIDDARSVLAMPLRTQGELLGALVVADRRGRVFTDGEQRMVAAFADQVALALRNARLFADRVRRQREAEELARVARALTESLDVGEVGRRVVDGVLSLFDACSSSLRLRRDDGMLVGIASGGPGGPHFQPGHLVAPGIGMAGLTVSENRSIWTRDVLDDPRIVMSDDLRARVEGAGVHAMLSAPLRFRGRTVGVLIIGDRKVREFSAAEVALLEAFADQAALALENARVHGEAERGRREAEVMAGIVRSINNASLDLDGTLQRVVEGARELCAADAAAISLRDPTTGEMVYRSWAEPRPSGYGGTRVVTGKGAGGRVLVTGVPFRTDDYLNDPRITRDYVEAVRQAGTVALLVVPIRIEGSIAGLLYVDNLSPRPFTDRDEAVLLRLADHAGTAIGNAGLYAEARSRARGLRTLSALTETITSAQVSEQLVDAVATAAVALLRARVSYVWVADPAARVLRPEGRAGVDTELERRLMQTPVFRFGEGIPGRIIESREPIYVRDSQADPRSLNPRLIEELGLHAYAGLPLLDGDRAVGVLSILFGEVRDFTAEEKELMALLAGHAAIAIRNAQLYRREQSAVAEARESAARYQGLFHQMPIALFRTGADGRVLDANPAAIAAFGFPGREAALGVNLEDAWVDRDARERAWRSVERTGEVRDIEARQRRFDGSVGWFRLNIRAVRDEHGRTVAFEGSAEDITRRKAVEEALRQRTARLEMLHELDWAILTAEAPEAIAEAALRGIARLVPCDHGSVVTVRPGRSEATVLASYGLGRAWRGKGPGLPAAAARHLEALSEGRLYVTEETEGPEPGSRRHYLTVPMLFGGEVAGAMSLTLDGADGFTAEQVEIAREVADPLAVAIQQSRLHDEVRAAHVELQRLTARIVEAQESERRRIARELHDEVGQVLIGLKLSLEGSARLVGEAARARLGGAQVLVTDLIGRLRDLSLDLRPPMLDDLGLLPALLWLFERYTSNTHVRVAFRHAGLERRRFAAETETAVYRIVQEALTNVARHAGVDEASVQIWTAEGMLHVRVRDQGKGFDVDSAPPAGESSGLGGMRERAAVLGGRLGVESARGGGTLVTAELPVAERIGMVQEAR